jgi:hypothetical protein
MKEEEGNIWYKEEKRAHCIINHRVLEGHTLPYCFSVRVAGCSTWKDASPSPDWMTTTSYAYAKQTWMP